MNLILYLSEAVIPILVLLIVGNGLMHRQHVYEDFLEGAKSGIRTAVEIMPTLIGLCLLIFLSINNFNEENSCYITAACHTECRHCNSSNKLGKPSAAKGDGVG